MASERVRNLEARLYGRIPDRFHVLTQNYAKKASRILVFGAGRGAKERSLQAPGRSVVGVDVDPVVSTNPMLDEAAVYDGHTLPFADDHFDLCTTRQVIEHLPDPARSFAEIARVLRPGGRFVFQTSNRWFYAFIIAQIVPNSLHPAVIKLIGGRDKEDVFPTLYRANTRGRLKALLEAVGLREVELGVHLRSPPYLRFSLPMFLLGVAHERIVNSSPAFEDLRGFIVGDFAKPGTLEHNAR
jgi:SAM-dependent methyltransferase